MNKRIKEPENKNSFGYVMWLILGSRDIRLTEASHHLGITLNNLSDILHDRHHPTQGWLTEMDWRGALQDNYPAGWEAHQAEFEHYAATLNVGKDRKPDFRRAASNIMRRHVDAIGDDADTLDQDTRVHNLKGKWRRILGGDSELGEDLFQLAVVEFCRLYSLDESNDAYWRLTYTKRFARPPNAQP